MPIQGTTRNNILTRVSSPEEAVRRYSDSWIEFNMYGLNAYRLTGYVGRVGHNAISGTSPRVATIYGDYGDGYYMRRLAYFIVFGDTPVRHFDINIEGVRYLRIHYQALGPAAERGPSLAMYDLYIH